MSAALAENTTSNSTEGLNQTNLTQDNNTNLTENSTDDDSASLAEINDTEAIGADDEREIGSMNSPYGQRVRFFQLERQVTKNILVGSKVIETLNNTNSSLNLTKLETTLDEMNGLLIEIKNTSFDANVTQLSGRYLNLKKDAQNLTNDFRKSAQPFLNRTIRSQIMNATKDIDQASLKEIDKEIKLSKCEFNALEIEKVLTALNRTDSAFMDRVKVCNATQLEIRQELNSTFRNLTFEEMKEFMKKMRESEIKKTVSKRAIMEDIRRDYPQMRAGRQEVMRGRFPGMESGMNRDRVNLTGKFNESMNLSNQTWGNTSKPSQRFPGGHERPANPMDKNSSER
jgi:hypothetical protein